MEGIGCFVHSAIQQFSDAKLLYAPSYFIGSTTQDVICLEEEQDLNLSGRIIFNLKYEKNMQAAQTDCNDMRQLAILLLMDGVKKLSLSFM